MAVRKGLYRVLITGKIGNGILLIYIGDGSLAGIDTGGLTYKGNYRLLKQGFVDGVVNLKAPPEAALITGYTAGPGGAEIPIPFRFPDDFTDGRIVRFETPTGPINAKFEFVQGID